MHFTVSSEGESTVILTTTPEGVGTGRVEQLSSFSVRVAELNALSNLDFYRYVFEAAGDSKARRLFPSTMSIVEGLGKSAQSWVSALSSTLGVTNLRCCTLLPFRGVLAPRSTIRLYRMWCPLCLQDALTSGGTVYEPLVWRLSEVGWCPAHSSHLVDKCPECGRGNQTWASSRARVGCCRFCGCWLGRSGAAPENVLPNEFELFCANACEQLIELASDEIGSRQLLPSDQIVCAVRDIFFGGSGAQMERSLGVPRGLGNHYSVGAFPPPLHYYMRVLYYTGASVREVFVTNRFESKIPLRPAYSFQLRRAPAKRSVSEERVAETLRGALSQSPPPSVRRLADELNVDSQLMWRRCPELATDVAARHAEFVAEQATEHRKSFRAAVRQIVTRYGPSVDAKELKILLGDPWCYLNEWKREIIRDEMVRHSNATGKS